jgi:hypothetical protein
LAYYTRDFNNYVTAKLFTPLRDALARANEAKQAALQQGDTDSPAAASRGSAATRSAATRS